MIAHPHSPKEAFLTTDIVQDSARNTVWGGGGGGTEKTAFVGSKKQSWVRVNSCGRPDIEHESQGQ